VKRILITGVNGFVGPHLVSELKKNDYYIIGVGGKLGSEFPVEEIDEYFVLDLMKKNILKNIDLSKLDGIIHLAGLAAVGPSFVDPMKYINTNIGLEVNIFEACIKQKVRPKIVIVSSGSIYSSKNKMPINENSHISPTSPYAVSKTAQEIMASYYENLGFDVVIARPFNHIGPGQGLGFIVPDLAKQIIDFSNGNVDKVIVGNLDSQRDYTDVRDISKAYRLLYEKGKSGEVYNICSGSAISGNKILNDLMKIKGIRAEVKLDESKLRPSDNPIIVGDCSKIMKDTGWQPEISIEQTLKDILS
jgi:GDP-4-dehydro-6-deoxy-D-mannose reductase